MENNQIVDRNKELQKDIKYIQEDIIAYQKNGLICKWCKPINCITVTNMTKDRYIKFWQNAYKTKQDKESGRFDKITQVCLDKLENGMTDLDIIIDLESKSKDLEKSKLIKEITQEIIEKKVDDEDDI